MHDPWSDHAFQSIHDSKVIPVKLGHRDVAVQTVLSVSITELCANWTVAANVADREGLTGTAQRLRNDVEAFKLAEAAGKGFIVVIT